MKVYLLTMKRIAFTLVLVAVSVGVLSQTSDMDAPLIGIFLHDGPINAMNQFPNPSKFYTFVGTSYVEWISQTGAIPVLIPYDIPEKRLLEMLNKLDGFLLPGGDTPLSTNTSEPSQYMKAVQKVIDHSKSLYEDSKILFPIFAINEGFHALIYSFYGKELLSTGYNDLKADHPIIMNLDDLQNCKFFSLLDKTNLHYVAEKGSMYFNHDVGIEPVTLISEPNRLITEAEFWLIGQSKAGKNDDGRPFVSIIEHKKYPIYGVQFNPEKTQFERGAQYRFLDRSHQAVEFSSELAANFAEIARMKASSFSKIPDWLKSHFSNYLLPINSFYNSFEKIYIFPRFYSEIPEEKHNLGSVDTCSDSKPLEDIYTGTGLIDQ